nr:MAG: hypothetical protein [Crogonang virus 171]
MIRPVLIIARWQHGLLFLVRHRKKWVRLILLLLIQHISLLLIILRRLLRLKLISCIGMMLMDLNLEVARKTLVVMFRLVLRIRGL